VSYSTSGEGAVSIKLTLTDNIALPLIFSGQVVRELSMISGLNVDVVYSDTRASAVLAGKLLRKPVVCMLNQFNIPLEAPRFPWLAGLAESMMQAPSKIWMMSDVILVPDFPEPFTISKRTLNLPGKIKGKVVYLGPLAQRAPDTDRMRDRERRRLGVSDETLVFVHISGPRQEREALAEKLLDICPRVRGPYLFVMTRGRPMGTESVKEGNLLVLDWVEDVGRLFSAADIVVARGGHSTIATGLSYGRKMLLIPSTRHGEQTGNAIRAEELGLAKVIPYDSLTPASLQLALEQLLQDQHHPESHKRLEKLMLSLGGVMKAVEIMEEMGSA